MGDGLVDAATLAAARSGNKGVVARVLAAHYPQVYRMAVNLVGDANAGAAVARRVMRQSLSALDAWEHEAAPTRWFRHHTVLAAREAAPDAAPRRDVLLAPRGVVADVSALSADPGFVAFARALRTLDPQQREAFLLSHGEGFDLRQLGIAMDCSVEAAGVHLRKATDVLQALAGDQYRRRVAELKAAYAASRPDESLALPYARRLVRPGLLATLVHALAWLAWLAIVAGIACGAWWLWPRLLI